MERKESRIGAGRMDLRRGSRLGTLGAVIRSRLPGWLLALALALPGSALCESVYVATLRDRGADATNVGGGLYAVDLATGAARIVAPLRIGGAIPIGLTGLSVHPKTGVLYGITGGFAPSLPKSLVQINPDNGSVTLVGSLGMIASDIRFDRKGILYCWLEEMNRLGTIDVGTGAATPVPDFPAYGQTLGGGIAVDRDGVVYISANSSAGSIDTYDPSRKQLTTGPTLSGAPFVSSINSMAFSPSGTLYAVNSNLGTPAKSRLVTIDAKTGKVQEVAALPDDVDTLAFGVTTRERSWVEMPTNTRQWTFGGLALAVGLVLGLALGRVGRRRR